MNIRCLVCSLLALALASLPIRGAAAEGEPDPKKVEFFEKKVRPILVNHCYGCHSADTKPAGGLRVDDRNGLLVGGNNGPAVVPGHPEKSLLLKRSTQDGKRRMPLEGEHLNDQQIQTLTAWINDGAVWPALRIPITLGKNRAKYDRLKKEHWAWQPLTLPTVPTVADRAWPASDIDRFILAKLEAKKLKPVADAERRSLIRRVAYDLTGLPPTPQEIEAFEQDTSPTAYEKLVDRLLAAPEFGEQWARHWLDVARYGESTGPSRNIPYPHAWRYRDYVIDAIKADMPYDRFVQEQVAGDLLPAIAEEDRNRQRIATGFLALGVKDVNQRFKTRFIMDNVDEQIDVVTRSVLGLTVSCARCHDHKFDPVSQIDYYALAGIFTSTDNASGLRNLMGGGGLAYYVPKMLVRLEGQLPPADPAEIQRLTQARDKAKKAWDDIRGTPEGLKRRPNGQPFQMRFRLDYERAEAELNALTDPAQRGLVAHGVRDGSVIGDTEVRIRGEAEKLGPVVPRGFLTTFEVPDVAPIHPKQSGRLELAQWLTSPKNPLASRVIVNRVWAHLFGRGLVSTVDNFGVTGDTPSHPELLDHLAVTFQQDGWSLKKLIRRLVLSRAYRLGTLTTPEHLHVDPANTLLWRHSPRRLTAEEIRDSILAVSGTLDRKRPTGSPIQDMQMREIRDNGPEAKQIHESANRLTVRSLYLPLLRGLTPQALEPFDPVDQTLVSGSREVTTVPSQALFLLNSEFVKKNTLALAERLLADKEAGEAERIHRAYERALGRAPSEAEVERAAEFLADYASAYREQQVQDPIPPKQEDLAAWQAFVQALVASAEFRYVR
jgi:cytochrome c553